MRVDYAKQLPKKKKKTLRIVMTIIVIIAAMSIPFSLLLVKIAREKKQAETASATQISLSANPASHPEGQFDFYTLLPKSQQTPTENQKNP